jgi:hypothetical protein
MFELKSFKHFLSIIIVLSFSLVLQGCAGMLDGPTQDVAIDTIPHPAILTVDTQPGATYISPAIIKLERNKVHLIKAHYDGDLSATAVLTPKQGGEEIKFYCAFILCIPAVWPLGVIEELGPTHITMVLP